MIRSITLVRKDHNCFLVAMKVAVRLIPSSSHSTDRYQDSRSELILKKS